MPSLVDPTDPNAILDWIRSKFGARAFSFGDVHNAILEADVPLDAIMVNELLKQAAQRNLLTKTVRGISTSYAFKAQIHA
jgi:hypothetical protein